MRTTESCVPRSDLRRVVLLPVVDAFRAQGAAGVPGLHTRGAPTVAGDSSRPPRRDETHPQGAHGATGTTGDGGAFLNAGQFCDDDAADRNGLAFAAFAVTVVLAWFTAFGWTSLWVAQLCLWIAGGAS
jgi:hypothetical protein